MDTDIENLRKMGYVLTPLLGVWAIAVVVMNLGFAWAAGRIAESRRRGFLRWFVGGIFFGVFATLLVAILPKGRRVRWTPGKTA